MTLKTLLFLTQKTKHSLEILTPNITELSTTEAQSHIITIHNLKILNHLLNSI